MHVACGMWHAWQGHVAWQERAWGPNLQDIGLVHALHMVLLILILILILIVILILMLLLGVLWWMCGWLCPLWGVYIALALWHVACGMRPGTGWKSHTRV